MKKKFDAVVVGGGHNGLVNAAYLGKAGIKTLVLEKRDVLGGCCATEEVWPGYKVSTTSYVASLFHPKIVKELSLLENGLEFLPRDPPSFTPFKNGNHIFSWQDENKTVAEIAGFSERDAEMYPRYEGRLSDISDVVDKMLLMTPPDYRSNKLSGFKDIFKIATQGRNLSHEHLETFKKLMSYSVAEFLEEWFESDELIATLATDGIIGAYAGVETPGTAYVLLHHVMGGITDNEGIYHRGRWAYVLGGMGGIPLSIINSIDAHRWPVTIRRGTAVKEIVVNDGRVKGVVLDNDEYIESKIVVSNATPAITYSLVSELDPDFSKLLDTIKYKGATTKVNLVLRELPDFSALPGTDTGPQHRGTIHICEDIGYMERAWEDAKHGRLSEDPILEITIPSVYDDTLVPKGSGHHLMNIFAMYGTKDVNGGWEKQGPVFLERVIGKLAEYAPNVPGAIIHAQIITPDDLEEIYSLTGGCIFHGRMDLANLFDGRPIQGFAQYRGPIEGLYMCGSGTHPGGGVTGIPGHNAAREIIKDRRFRSVVRTLLGST